jgi:imidazolonepropionase-like amidohydrolase
MRIRCLFSLCALAGGLTAQTGVVVIRNARVVDGTGTPASVKTVIIRGRRISSVGENVPLPGDARIIDAAGQTLIPGVFDLHTHLRVSAAPGLQADWGKDLEAYVACGVTSVDDFGNYGEMFEPMRRLLQTGEVTGPRLHLAVRLSPPGGHGTEGGQGDIFTFVAATPQQARAVMRTALQYQPDIIKIFTDGWRYGTSPSLVSMNEETIAAIVEEAHKAGVKVLTHTVSLENAKIAVRAGVDALAHGIQDREVDDEFIRLIKAKGVAYVSTLAVYEPRNRTELYPGLEPVLEPAIRESMNRPEPAASEQAAAGRAERWGRLLHNNRALFDAGVVLGNGTDAGMGGVYHGWSTLREMELQTKAGLTPLQAITIATGNSARILGVDRDLGTIEPGKLADLVLVNGKPDERIEDIYKTARVFLDGKEYNVEELRKSIQSGRMTRLPSKPLGNLVDDFERADGRTVLGTLPLNENDSGIDHSKILFTRVWRKENDHALMIQASMGPKDRNFARIVFPLTPGGIELADVGEFKGVSFDVRGDGGYRVMFKTYGVRGGEDFNAPFLGDGTWKTLRIDFSSLVRKGGNSVTWTGQDVRELLFELSGPAAAKQWLELDNIRFY